MWYTPAMRPTNPDKTTATAYLRNGLWLTPLWLLCRSHCWRLMLLPASNNQWNLEIHGNSTSFYCIYINKYIYIHKHEIYDYHIPHISAHTTTNYVMDRSYAPCNLGPSLCCWESFVFGALWALSPRPRSAVPRRVWSPRKLAISISDNIGLLSWESRGLNMRYHFLTQ